MKAAGHWDLPRRGRGGGRLCPRLSHTSRWTPSRPFPAHAPRPGTGCTRGRTEPAARPLPPAAPPPHRAGAARPPAPPVARQPAAPAGRPRLGRRGPGHQRLPLSLPPRPASNGSRSAPSGCPPAFIVPPQSPAAPPSLQRHRCRSPAAPPQGCLREERALHGFWGFP